MADLDLVLASCATLGIEFVVIPLVDNGRDREPGTDRNPVARSAGSRRRRCRSKASRSFSNPTCRRPSSRSSSTNSRAKLSASITTAATAPRSAIDSAEEISAYAPRILNVHVKDRLLGGTTVPLGTGAADLAKAIRLIEQSGYRGQYILQTARATDGDHPGVLARYRDMTVRWIEDAGR